MADERGLEKLLTWQKAMDLAEIVCKEILHALPAEEKYALSAQLRRSVQSIPANIAEGHGRYYYQETIRFCFIARGSLEETRSHLLLAQRLGYLSDEHLRAPLTLIDEVRRLLNGYVAHLKIRQPGANEPGSQIREDSAWYETFEFETDDTSETC